MALDIKGGGLGANTQGVVPINDQTGTTYTLVGSDAGKYVRMSNALASTLTVPPNSSVPFPVGTQITIEQGGVGQVAMVEDVGVTINSPATLLLRDQYSVSAIVKVGVDEWTIMGDMEI